MEARARERILKVAVRKANFGFEHKTDPIPHHQKHNQDISVSVLLQQFCKATSKQTLWVSFSLAG
jgi:hypothetical protein